MLLRIETNSFVRNVHAFPLHTISVGKFPTAKARGKEYAFEIRYCYDDKRIRRIVRSSIWQQKQQRCRCFADSNSDSESGDSAAELEQQQQQQLHLQEEARIAVSMFLQQMGVSVEQSESISSNSPSYLNMLMEGVRDLEQLDSTVFNSNFNYGHNYKDKIIYIASLKGDNGKLAYLESIGFTLSSSMNVARHISYNLPTLIDNVTSIKKLLFPPTYADHYRLLINDIRLVMHHLSISIDEDMQHTFSFFQKLQAKPGGLNIFASQDAAFCCLIESFPRILLLSVTNHMLPILDFLQNIGIPSDRIPNIILAFPPILLWNVRLLQTRVLALNEIDGVDNKDCAKLMSKYPWILSTSIQQNYKEIVAFFYSVKVLKTRINHAIIRQPQLLGCSTSKLKLMVDQFAKLGVERKMLDRVIAKSPQLLVQKPEDFLQVVLFFQNIGFDKENIGRILARCPEVFATNISKTLQRKIEFLSRIGISKADLPVVIKKYPELLVSDVDEALPQRIVYLMKLGLSKKQISFMVCTFSPLLGYSIEEVLKPKIEFLVNSMKRPVRDVVGYPRYFSYSLEKKIKPRFWALKGRNIECSLKDMLGKNDEEFADEFMSVERTLVCPPMSSHDIM